jgi:hypothetical protein
MGIRKLLLVSCLVALAGAAQAQDGPRPDEGGGELPPPPPPPDDEPPPEGEPPPPLVGSCITPVGMCEGDGPCGEGGICIEGVCIVAGNECRGQADCDDRSVCYAVGDACERPEDCQEPFVCQANLCVAVLLGPPPDGMMCAPDDVVCQSGGVPPSCMDSSQCAGGECIEGQCQFRTNPECTDESCPMADGEGVLETTGEPDDLTDQGEDVREQLEDQQDMQAPALACTVSQRGSRLGGLGLLLALSALVARRRRA